MRVFDIRRAPCGRVTTLSRHRLVQRKRHSKSSCDSNRSKWFIAIVQKRAVWLKCVRTEEMPRC